ncbi:MAG: ABC transporter ATP-binding protein [Deltaproteobacteria bacterium]|nr:ABC transporter ATP-binding protein [Deltaproteobacteria bacterium]
MPKLFACSRSRRSTLHTDFGYFEEEALGKPYDIKLMKRLYPFTRPYRRLLFASILLVMFITLLDLSIPYVTKIAIDRYIVPVGIASSAFPDRKEEKRYYHVPLRDPEALAIVRKYTRLFQIDQSVARISFEDLSRLDKEDVARLRQKDAYGVARLTVVFLMLIVANFGFNFLQVMIMEYTAQRIMHDLRARLFRHMQSLSVSFFNRNPVGRLVTRVTNDVQNMHELFTSVVSFVFKDLFLLIGIAAVLVGIDWKLAAVSFSVLPVVIYASFVFSGRARKIFRVLRMKVAEINTKLSETISGMKVIQLFNREADNLRSFEKLNHENYMAEIRQIRLFGVFMPFIEFMGVVTVAVVLYYGGGGVIARHVSLGALVAFISYMRMFFRPIRDIAEKYNILQNAMASAERIFLILDNKDRLPQRTGGGRSMLLSLDRIRHVALDRVSFAYVPDEPVLKEVSFRLHFGQTLGIVGPTGSGKTTLIYLITRFYDPTSGRVLINGRDIRNLPPADFRARMALVMQEPFLFSATVRENIFWGNRRFSESRIDRILTASNCKTFIEKLPQGLDTVLSEGTGAISSGERQLISIARAMARDPDLIILDEATSYIDSQTEQKVQDALFNLLRSRTAIVVAHRLSTIRHADRIMVLNRGRIIEEGTHSQLMEKQGFYFRLHRLQS